MMRTSRDLIDEDGYRANVGIILSRADGQLFWAGRARGRGWQFPQGGIRENEEVQDALFRELQEEVGLERDHVEILGSTRDWLHYRLPRRYLRTNSEPLCVGQKQRWYMLRLVAREETVCLNASEVPEFDRWRWVDYWHPIKEVIYFKREVYATALEELAPLIFPSGIPPRPRWWSRVVRRSRDIRSVKSR